MTKAGIIENRLINSILCSPSSHFPNITIHKYRGGLSAYAAPWFQKAKKWLQENNIEFEDRHIIEQTPTVEELREWIKRSGLEIRKWFNTSGLKYKELNLKDKLDQMIDEEKLALLASDGMLIKRPVLVSDKGTTAGFREEKWKEIVK